MLPNPSHLLVIVAALFLPNFLRDLLRRIQDEKPASGFHKNRANADGLQYYCVPCHNLVTCCYSPCLSSSPQSFQFGIPPGGLTSARTTEMLRDHEDKFKRVKGCSFKKHTSA